MFVAKTRIESQDAQFRPIAYDPGDPVPDEVAAAVPQCVEEVNSIVVTDDQGRECELIDITKLTKAELEDYADKLGLQIDPAKMSKAEMRDAITAEEDRLAAMDEARAAAGITVLAQQGEE